MEGGCGTLCIGISLPNHIQSISLSCIPCLVVLTSALEKKHVPTYIASSTVTYIQYGRFIFDTCFYHAHTYDFYCTLWSTG